jgi:hypothetical protein
MKPILTYLLVTLSAIVLTACGRDGDGSATSTVNVPLSAAIQNSVDRSHAYKFSVSGYYGTNKNTLTGTGSRTVTAASPSSFNGAAYQKSIGITTGSAITASGQELNLDVRSVEYINPATSTPAFDDSETVFAAYSGYAYPAKASTGDGRKYGSVTLYTNSSMTTRSGSGTISYQLLPNDSSSLILKQVTKIYNSSKKQTLESITTSTVTTKGVVTDVSFEQYRYATSGSTPYYIKYTFK